MVSFTNDTSLDKIYILSNKFRTDETEFSEIENNILMNKTDIHRDILHPIFDNLNTDDDYTTMPSSRSTWDRFSLGICKINRTKILKIFYDDFLNKQLTVNQSSLVNPTLNANKSSFSDLIWERLLKNVSKSTRICIPEINFPIYNKSQNQWNHFEIIFNGSLFFFFVVFAGFILFLVIHHQKQMEKRLSSKKRFHFIKVDPKLPDYKAKNKKSTKFEAFTNLETFKRFIKNSNRNFSVFF